MKPKVRIPKSLIPSGILIVFLALGPEMGTPSGSIDFKQLELGVVEELNNARTHPRSYAAHLKEMSRHFHGKELRLPGETPVRTKEGVTAVIEAIRFLEKATPLPVMKRSRGMSQGARDHVELQARTGSIGHETAEGIRAWDRVNNYGTWEKTIGENIAYGPSRARDIVASLIVDDGVQGRGHRQNIFNPVFRVVGTSCGPHPEYGTMCVIIFAGGYHEKED